MVIGLLITSIISGVLSFLISLLTKFDITLFIIYFISITLVQIILWSFVKYAKLQYKNYLRKLLELKEIETLNKFEYTISCASCHKDFNILLGLNEDNIFKCPHCNELNKVYLDIKNVIQLTNIQDINSAQTQIYNELKNKISENE